MKTLMRKQKRNQKLEQKMKCRQDDEKRISDIKEQRDEEL